MPDGSIVISTELDNKDLMRQLAKVRREIEKLEQATTKKRADRNQLVEQYEALSVSLDRAKEKLAALEREHQSIQKTFSPTSGSAGDYTNIEGYLSTYSRKESVEASLKAQQSEVGKLQSKWDSVADKVEKYDLEIRMATGSLANMKEHAGSLEKEFAQGSSGGDNMGKAVQRAEKSLGKFKMRLREVIRSALIFTVITQALAKFRDWIGNVIQSNTEASAALARLKGALLTLVQPLVNIIIPAFTVLVNVLAKVIAAIESVVSMLFGTTAKESAQAAEGLYEETSALDGVGDAAKKAGKSLASFDELNKLSGADTGGGSGGTSGIKPDFDLDFQEGEMNGILAAVSAIGAGLLAWKIASGFTESLSAIAGIAMIVAGAVMLVYNWLDAWNNGIDWGNLIGMIAGLALVAGGLALVLGPVAAGIALIVGGIALLVVGIKDAMENGLNLQNMLAVIGGMLAAGVGISLLTGSWIPLLLAGIASVLLAIVYFTGHGEELISGLREIFGGFIDFFTGVFTGNFQLAAQGLERIFGGLGTVFGAIIDGIRDAFFGFLDWLDEKTGGRFTEIIGAIKTIFGGLFDGIKQAFNGLTEFIVGVFTGDWERAWQGIKEFFKGIWNAIIGILESAINLIVRGLNFVIGKINSLLANSLLAKGLELIGVSMPQIPTISEAKLPRLATGAVIPPNREFLAVLGDQRSGTNIEAPEGLIRKIFREESGSPAVVAELREILDAVRAGKIMMVDNKVMARVVQTALSNTARANGSAVPVR